MATACHDAKYMNYGDFSFFKTYGCEISVPSIEGLWSLTLVIFPITTLLIILKSKQLSKLRTTTTNNKKENKKPPKFGLLDYFLIFSWLAWVMITLCAALKVANVRRFVVGMEESVTFLFSAGLFTFTWSQMILARIYLLTLSKQCELLGDVKMRLTVKRIYIYGGLICNIVVIVGCLQPILGLYLHSYTNPEIFTQIFSLCMAAYLITASFLSPVVLREFERQIKQAMDALVQKSKRDTLTKVSNFDKRMEKFAALLKTLKRMKIVAGPVPFVVGLISILFGVVPVFYTIVIVYIGPINMVIAQIVTCVELYILYSQSEVLMVKEIERGNSIVTRLDSKRII